MKKLLTSTALMFGALAGVAYGALSTPGGASGTIQYSVAVCDPNSPFRCVAPNATGGIVVGAGENHVGEVGSNHMVIKNALTTTASATYTTGLVIGGKQTLANAVRVSGVAGAAGTGGFIQNVALTFSTAPTGVSADIYYFDSDPTGSTCTDNAAFALVAADYAKVIGIAHVTDFTGGNVVAVAQAQNLAMSFDLVSSTTIYACVVARSSLTVTTGTTGNVNLTTQILRD